MRGPTTPVCMLGKPCSEPAVGAVLAFSRAGRVVHVRVGAGGRYAVRLARGTYTVRELPAAKIGTGVRPDRVRVAGPMRADFFIDTGIR